MREQVKLDQYSGGDQFERASFGKGKLAAVLAAALLTVAADPVGGGFLPGEEKIDPPTLRIRKTNDGRIELVARAVVGQRLFLYESKDPEGPWSLVRVPPEPREPVINRPRLHSIIPVEHTEVWRLPADQAGAYFKVYSEPWAPLK